MKIAIDISQVIYGTGVSKYTDGLVRHLLQIDHKNEYTFYGGSIRRIDDFWDYFSTLKGKYHKKLTPISPFLADLLWNRFRGIKIDTFLGKVDVFHSSDWTQPPTSAYKVTTVHDLYFKKYPQYVHSRIVKTHMKRLEIVKHEADCIIVPSQSTKDDLVVAGFSKDKIVVIPEAPAFDMAKASQSKIDAIHKKYKIKGDYILGIGINPRKNTKRIIAAYKRIAHDMQVKLVLIGRPSNISIKKETGIVLTGFVPEDDMAAFISGAQVLVYPSLYEGFGIPVLDGFACDTPVVTSNISSLPEVSGKAAIMVDPRSVNEIAQGIRKAFDEKDDLIEKGRKQLKKYSWKKTAEATLEVYKKSL